MRTCEALFRIILLLRSFCENESHLPLVQHHPATWRQKKCLCRNHIVSYNVKALVIKLSLGLVLCKCDLTSDATLKMSPLYPFHEVTGSLLDYTPYSITGITGWGRAAFPAVCTEVWVRGRGRWMFPALECSGLMMFALPCSLLIADSPSFASCCSRNVHVWGGRRKLFKAWCWMH